MADAPLTALEQALNVALVEARSIAHAQPVGLTPTYHNQLRRAGEKRPYNMADAKRDARNAVTAIEQAFEALIAYQALAATPSPPVAATPDTAPMYKALQDAYVVLCGYNSNPAWKSFASEQAERQIDAILNAVPEAAQPQPQPAQPLTADQRQDLLAAAFYIACRNEPGATLKDVDAERIADLLTELSGFDLARITAPSTPTPPEVAP